MDEAFVPASEILRQIASIEGELFDRVQGVRSRIHRFEIEMPLELSMSRADDGRLLIGSTPPLYYVDTSFRPSYHRISLTAVLGEPSDDD